MNPRAIIFLPLLLWCSCQGQSLVTDLSSLRFILHSGDQSPVFVLKNNPAYLSSLQNLAAGFYSERKYLLTELNYHTLVAAVNTGSGGFGFYVDYRGSPLYNETKLSLAHGRKLGNSVQCGLQLNLNSIAAGSYGKGSHITFTSGIVWLVGDHLQAAVMVEENFSNTFGTGDKENWPGLYSLSLLYKVSGKVNVGSEILKWRDQPIQFITAGDYSPVQKIKITGGVSIPGLTSFIGVNYLVGALSLGIYTRHHMQLGISPGMSISSIIKKRKK